jgi:hypothetical protein
MPLVLSTEPIINSAGKISNWNAASTPIIFEYIRKDYITSVFTNTGSNLKLRYDGIDLTAIFDPGDVFYFQNTNGVLTQGNITVLTSTFTGGNTEVVFVEDFADYSNSGGSWVNDNVNRRNYRVIVGISINGVSYAFQYTPNSTGYFTIDLSAIAQAAVSDRSFIPIPAGPVVEEEVDKWYEIAINNLNFGVLYNTGSTDTDPGISAINVINAARQIGCQYDSNLYEYVAYQLDPDNNDIESGQFLTRFDAPRVYEGWPFSLSFITSISNNDPTRKYYPVADGVNIDNVGSLISTLTEKMYRLVWDEMTETEEVKLELIPLNIGTFAMADTHTPDTIFVGETQRYGVVFTAPANAGFSLQLRASDPFKFGSPTNTVRLRLCATAAGIPDEGVVLKTVDYTPSANGNILNFSDISLSLGTDYAFTWAPNADGTSDASNYWIINAGIDSGAMDSVGFVKVGVGAWTALGGDSPTPFGQIFLSTDALDMLTIIEPITLTPTDVCDNPIMLFWKNSLGGDSWFMFDHNQEMSIEGVGGRKVKRMVLFAENLTLNEWEALNELIVFRDEFQNQVLKLSEYDRTKSTDGQSVFVVDQDGTPTGVTVITNRSRSMTNNETHRFEIEIEFPEIYYQK